MSMYSERNKYTYVEVDYSEHVITKAKLNGFGVNLSDDESVINLVLPQMVEKEEATKIVQNAGFNPTGKVEHR